jgi:hypothetical protein
MYKGKKYQKTQQDLTSMRRDHNLRKRDAIISIARIPLPEEVEKGR